MKKEYHPYPPFDFNFYIDTDVSFKQDYERLEEGANADAVSLRHYFNFTPYIRGNCVICGKSTVFFCKNLIHPRDYLICMHCGSTSRYRAIAKGIISALEDLTGQHIDSLADLKRVDLGRKISIYDTQLPFSLGVVAYPVPYYLSLSENIDLYLSDMNYKGGGLGGNGEKISCQNLEKLTYESNKFDIVITSDVMEHVRLPKRAHAEIARVTRNGGLYLFTVPHFRDKVETEYLLRILDEDDPSRDEHVGEPMYHGDPNSEGAALVYQIFGTDIDDELKKHSFDVLYQNEMNPALGLVGAELFYCKKKSAYSILESDSKSEEKSYFDIKKWGFFKR